MSETSPEAIVANLQSVRSAVPAGVRLVAVSKFHPAEAVAACYAAGQRLFGENRPQELAAKAAALPADIQWHFLGHLQTNKLRMVLPHASLVQSIDSVHLLEAVSRYVREGRPVHDPDGRVRVLLEVHLGSEQTKQGFTQEEALSVLRNAGSYPEVAICGLMGMATNTGDMDQVGREFDSIRNLFAAARYTLAAKDATGQVPWPYREFSELSIGMSGDWPVAVANGATIVRIGTAIFGERDYSSRP